MNIELPTDADPVKVIHADCLDVLRALPDGCVDAFITDPPAGIAFMGKGWDENKGGRDHWIEWLEVRLAECLRVTKPGGRLLCWAIPRTSHWTATAVEDAGWHIENKVYHLFGTGFPKGKSQLKPAAEEWVLARKPGGKVPPLGIDECRVPCEGGSPSIKIRKSVNKSESGVIDGNRWVDRRSVETFQKERPGELLGRYPANVLHDGSYEVMEAFAAFGESVSKAADRGRGLSAAGSNEGWKRPSHEKYEGSVRGHNDTGTAARFFYCAKASKADRGVGNTHPTVKPTSLMQWLVKLVCPAGGTVLDPFAGSGSTGKACLLEGRKCVLIEREKEYVEIIKKRLWPKDTLFS